jgi:hypothetical protein
MIYRRLTLMDIFKIRERFSRLSFNVIGTAD